MRGFRGRPRHQKPELIASPPRRDVRDALRAFEHFRNTAEGGAAEGMAQFIVQGLQPVDIDEQEGERFAETSGVRSRSLVMALECSGVDEVRHGIPLRQASVAIPPAPEPVGAPAGEKPDDGKHEASAEKVVEIEEGVVLEIDYRSRSSEYTKQEGAGGSTEAKSSAERGVFPSL